jgi:hypothetical protein
MNVTKEVIMDLLPLYLSGEGSPATRILVEEFLRQDPELAQRVRLAGSIDPVLPSALRPELELRTLHRTRGLLVLLRWLFGLGMFFTAIALGAEMNIANGHLTHFRFLIQEYPVPFGVCLAIGLICWAAYFSLRQRLRIAVFRP